MDRANLLTNQARFRKFMLLVMFLFSLPMPVQASESKHHPLHEIYQAVEQFLVADQGEEGVTIDVSPLDSRLRLKACSVPLLVDYQRSRSRSGRTIVQVRCQGEKPWRIYVTATVRKLQNVVVTLAPILKGERVALENLAYEQRDISRLRHGFFEEKEQLKGKFAKKAIRGDVVLTPQQLFVPNLIDKGDQVSILFQKGDLKVQMKGVALENGHRDGKIRVKNSSSGKIVEGTVIAPGRIKIAE